MDTASSIPLSSSPVVARLIGTPDAPLFVDVRKAEDFATSDHFIPGSIRWDYHATDDNPALPSGKNVVAYCVKGLHVGITGAEKMRAPDNVKQPSSKVVCGNGWKPDAITREKAT
jgi:rhodanese-related sulfurtransferase